MTQAFVLARVLACLLPSVRTVPARSVTFQAAFTLNSFWLFLAGAMTLIPLFLFLKGVELAGLGPSGMIFFLTPTGQFLLGIFYYNEFFDFTKFIGFIIIWIGVLIYLIDLKNTEKQN